jgi:cyclase
MRKNISIIALLLEERLNMKRHPFLKTLLLIPLLTSMDRISIIQAQIIQKTPVTRIENSREIMHVADRSSTPLERGDVSIEPFPYQEIGPNLYKIEVDDNSIIASIGPEGVLLCDVGGESKGSRVMETVRKLGGDKINYIINTHWHVDHTGGNKCFGKEALIIAHENVRKRLSEDKYLAFWEETHPAFPDYALPDIVFSDRMTMYLNGIDIEIIHFPKGHTDGDAIVYFRQFNILHIGDCLFSNGFPAVDFETGGSVEGFADNLRKIAILMPQDVTIITGHGPDYTIKELQAYETMVRSSLDAVRNAMQKRWTLKAMLEADLLKEWEEYSHGFFSRDEWIEMIYQSLLHHSKSSSNMTELRPPLKGTYLGQKPPGTTPEVFAPGIVSIEDGKEYKPTISPDATEIFFIRRTPHERNDCIWTSRLENGELTTSRTAPFTYRCFEGQPCFTPDGKRLFYMSCRPLPGESTTNRLPHPWFVDKTDTGWSDPRYYASTIDEHCPAQISMANDGTVYFVSNVRRKIFFAEPDNGLYGDPQLLQCGVNDLVPVGHPAISPDESYIVVDRVSRNNNKLVSDMYISFKRPDGTWTSVESMREILKMTDSDVYAAPRITYDGKYLFFEKYDMETDKSDIYWVDTKIIDELKPKELK